MTAGLGQETGGLGTGSCLSGRQTTVSIVYTDFLLLQLVNRQLAAVFDFVLSS